MTRRVLVRDRNVLRSIVKIFLSGMGFELVAAATDEEARARLLDGAVDVLVADLDETPDALELVRGAWRLEHEGVPSVPALFMSSDPKAGPVVSSELFVLEKPVYRDVFQDALRRLTAVRAS